MIMYADTSTASSSAFRTPTLLVPWDMDMKSHGRVIIIKATGTKDNYGYNTLIFLDRNKICSRYSDLEIELDHHQARVLQRMEKGFQYLPPPKAEVDVLILQSHSPPHQITGSDNGPVV